MFGKKKSKEKEQSTTVATTSSSLLSNNNVFTASSLYNSTTTRTTSSVTQKYVTESITIRKSFSGTATPPNSLASSGGSTQFNFSNMSRPRNTSHPGIEHDAKPFTAISSTTSNVPKVANMNYQSPYRNSPGYSSMKVNIPSSSSSGTALQRNTPLSSSFSIPPRSAKSQKNKVILSSQYMDGGETAVPTYTTRRRKRGKVLIINNIMFKNQHHRTGAKKDDKDLEDIFEQMGFSVTKHRDLKKTDMESKIKSFSKKSSLEEVDISIVVVMSHGTNRKKLGGYTEIFGVDDQPCVVDDILKYFTAENCKYMKDKPKIFIFQCCRGDNEKFIESDAVKTNAVGFSDMLIAYSTLPGFVSNRDTTEGTWYIQTICEVFRQNAHQQHVEDLLKMVDYEMSKKQEGIRQISTYENRGFKRCFLHPGLRE